MHVMSYLSDSLIISGDYQLMSDFQSPAVHDGKFDPKV